MVPANSIVVCVPVTIGVPVVTCLHRVRRIHKAAQTPLPRETSITCAWAVASPDPNRPTSCADYLCGRVCGLLVMRSGFRDTVRGTVLDVGLHVTWELAKPYISAQSFTQCPVTDTNISQLRIGRAICFTFGNVALAKYKHGGRGHDN